MLIAGLSALLASRRGGGAGGAATTATTGAPGPAGPGGWPRPSAVVIVLEVPANGTVIWYRESLHYSPSGYSYIRSHWLAYASNLSARLKGVYASRGAEVSGVEVIGLDYNHTVEASFTVTNKVWVSNGEVTADFLWFLDAWGLDFIGSHFRESRSGLSWSGSINGTRVSIVILVPTQPGPYRAWGEPYGHCHGHIWWPAGNG